MSTRGASSCAGSAGLAHVRYPTAGGSSAKEAQPFFVNSPLGMFLIHNGNLTNTPALREELQSSTSFFNRMLRTPSDSEVLLNVFADEIHRAHQQCIMQNPQMDPNERKMQFVQEAGQEMMQVRQHELTRGQTWHCRAFAVVHIDSGAWQNGATAGVHSWRVCRNSKEHTRASAW